MHPQYFAWLASDNAPAQGWAALAFGRSMGGAGAAQRTKGPRTHQPTNQPTDQAAIQSGRAASRQSNPPLPIRFLYAYSTAWK